MEGLNPMFHTFFDRLSVNMDVFNIGHSFPPSRIFLHRCVQDIQTFRYCQ